MNTIEVTRRQSEIVCLTLDWTDVLGEVLDENNVMVVMAMVVASDLNDYIIP